MGAKSLGECFEEGVLNGQIFLSKVAVTGKMHVLYKFDRVDDGMLYVFPVKLDGRRYVVEDESVGVLYRQHLDDTVCTKY